MTSLREQGISSCPVFFCIICPICDVEYSFPYFQTPLVIAQWLFDFSWNVERDPAQWWTIVCSTVTDLMSPPADPSPSTTCAGAACCVCSAIPFTRMSVIQLPSADSVGISTKHPHPPKWLPQGASGPPTGHPGGGWRFLRWGGLDLRVDSPIYPES